MIRKRLMALVAMVCSAVICHADADDLAQKYARFGNLIITQFATAPFPHPDRAAGHYYKTNFFPADKHYRDSTVAVFVPKNFRAGESLDFVVHFHGWGNNVARALERYRLIEQFCASDRNAILIVPQGPYNASDSFDGKLEDTNGFARFMAEALNVLETTANIHNPKAGKIILSGHSGGYQVISSILDRGGLSDHVREVWLFDALYGRTEKFVKWFSASPHDSPQGGPNSDLEHLRQSVRFIDLYTEHGGTKDESEKLMADLKNQNTPYFFANEKETQPARVQNQHLVFLFTENTHDEVMQKNDTFLNFLRTSQLADIRPQDAK